MNRCPLTYNPCPRGCVSICRNYVLGKKAVLSEPSGWLPFLAFHARMAWKKWRES
jgi:hypothetical protein